MPDAESMTHKATDPVPPAPSRAGGTLALRLAAFVAALLCSATVAVYAVRGFYARPMLDDYGNIASVRSQGLWHMLADSYAHWNGRFMTVPSFYAAAQLPAELYGVTAVVLIALLFTSLCALSRVWLKPTPAVIAAAAMAYGCLALVPNPGQSFYWTSSSVCYLLPLSFTCFLAACVLRIGLPASRQARGAVLVGVMLLAAATAGYNEMVAACAPWLLGALWLERRRTPQSPVTGTALIGSVIGLLVVVKSPGNVVRRAYFPGHPSVSHILSDSFAYSQQFLHGVLSPAAQSGLGPSAVAHPLATIVVVAVVAGIAIRLSGHTGLNRSEALPRIAVALVAGLATVFVCFGVGAYSVHAALPERALTFPVLAVTATAAYIGGVVGLAARRGRWAVLVALVVALWFGPLADTRTALASVGAARAYAARWDQSDRAFRSGIPVPTSIRPTGLYLAVRAYYKQSPTSRQAR